MKKTHQITVHLSEDCACVVGALADKVNLSKSEWVRLLIEDDLRRRYHQAHHDISLLSRLENDEIVASHANYHDKEDI